jgi:hypothetical protein
MWQIRLGAADRLGEIADIDAGANHCHRDVLANDSPLPFEDDVRRHLLGAGLLRGFELHTSVGSHLL